ncbi:MAG: HEPN domain-containing protein [Atribacterota bacterium]
MKLEEIVAKKRAREEKLQDALKRIVTQLREWGALKVVLLGSFACGTVDFQSDLDLLVIMPSSQTSKAWIDQIYQHIERGIATDMVIYSQDDFEKMLPESSFLQEIFQSGGIVYEKKPREEALRWFLQAQDEFNDAEFLRQSGRFYLALFHFQQAAEKVLKAYLYLRVADRQVFFTRSIDELLQMVQEIDTDFASLTQTEKLNQHDTPTAFLGVYPPVSIPTQRKPKKQWNFAGTSWNSLREK